MQEEVITEMEVQERILNAAFSMFCKVGIRSVSMDEIAQNLAVSKKTLYKWFKNKDEIVYASFQRYLANIKQECDKTIIQAKNAMEELFYAMQIMRNVFSKIHPSVFYDLQKYYSKTWNMWQEFKNSILLEMIKENLQRGIKENLYRSSLEIEIIARLRLGQIDLILNPQLYPPQHFDLKQVQQECLEHFMLGISTLKGHRLINNYKNITEVEV